MTRLLIQGADGTLARKARAALRPPERVVLDGPQARARMARLQLAMDEELNGAGGLRAWRAQLRAATGQGRP